MAITFITTTSLDPEQRAIARAANRKARRFMAAQTPRESHALAHEIKDLTLDLNDHTIVEPKFESEWLWELYGE